MAKLLKVNVRKTKLVVGGGGGGVVSEHGHVEFTARV